MKRRRNKPVRRWWQRVCRWGAVVALLLAAVVVTLPWWAPTEMVRNHLARRLSEDVGAEVEIESLELSWAEVRIGGLTIRQPPGFDAASGPMVRVDRIRTSFAPWDLVRGRIGWMEINSPIVHIATNADGRPNIQPLIEAEMDLQASSITVHDGTVILDLPARPGRLVVGVSDLQVVEGAVRGLGRVTMSGTVAQDGQPATVAVHLGAGGADAETAADASLSFAGVDLSRFDVPRLLDLPLRRLTGRLGGSVKVHLNRRGQADRIGVDVHVRDLDAQPIMGPALPVIYRAGVKLDASFDPFSGRIDVESLAVNLPGLDMSGSLVASSDVGSGGWQAIESVDMEGVVHPMRLAAMLTGEPALPGGLVVDGPIDLKVTGARGRRRFSLRLAADATGATVRRGQRPLKPAGRTLGVRMGGVMDERTWVLVVDEADVALGDNAFRGRGRIDLRHLTACYVTGDGMPTFDDVAACLAGVEWRGDWTVRDTRALADASPWLESLLSAVRIDGVVTGRAAVERRGATHLSLQIELPAGADLATGGFVKPVERPMALSVDAALHGERPILRDVNAGLQVGKAWIGLHHAAVELDSAGDVPIATLRGRYSAERVGELLACVPADGSRPLRLAGTIHGECVVQLSSVAQRANLSADLLHTEIAAGELFVKPAGRAARATVNLLVDEAAPRDRRYAADADVDLPGLSAALWSRAGIQADANRGATVHGGMHLRVTDAARLVEGSPALRRALGEARLTGSAVADVEASWARNGGTLNLAFVGDALEFRSTDGRRRKRAGVPLRGRLSAAVPASDTGGVRIRMLAADFGESHVELLGTTPPRPPAWDAASPGEPIDLRFRLRAVPDDALRAIAPEIASIADAYGLGGAVRAEVHCADGPRGFELHADLDATDASVRFTVPDVTLPVWQEGVQDDVAPPLRPLVLVKPADMTADLRIELAVARDLSRVHLRNLLADVGDLHLVAGAEWRRSGGAFAWRRPVGAHLAVSTQHAESLVELAPGLRPYQPAGGFTIDLAARSGEDERLSHLLVDFDGLRARLAGEEVLLDGHAGAYNVRPRAVPPAPETRPEDAPLLLSPEHVPWTMELAELDSLELRVGENHGWVNARMTDAPDAPKVGFELLCSHLDDSALSDWMDRVAEPWRDPAAATQPAEPPERFADRLIAAIKPYAETSTLSGRMHVNDLRTFDASVEEHYRPQEVELSADVANGELALRYAGALLGGMIRQRIAVNLADDTPRVSFEKELNAVNVAENMQPQLARHFPGNTVYGTMDRMETLSAPLRDVVAGAIDPEYPVHPVGEATTITRDGLVVGRAAPKFVTAIFPGLNLARYRYDRMTAFATYDADGTVHNEMIFSGRTYDMYIEGETGPDGMAEYEIGLILLGSLAEARTHRAWRQGRFPILEWRARIVDGRLLNESVSYPWPTATAFTIFLKNNAVYRAWVNARRK